ncbi:MAG: magnesium/cobalt transporter CorA [Steroidobacteraceae bacterium]|nr:magnesium/cobalt transporter CorA [Steroidobacteraceae bacterium]
MLLSCAAYENGQKLADITPQEIGGYLQRPGCFVWVAVRDPQPGELDVLSQAFGLHPLAVEDASKGHQRPKIEEYGNSLFAVLHLIEREGTDLRIGELAIFTGPNYVVSVREGVNMSFQDVRARCEREPHLLSQGPGYVLYALMDAVVDRYFPLLDDLEDELDAIEQRMFAAETEPRANIEEAYELKQRLLQVKHAVAPLLEATSNLSGARVPGLCASLREYFRDVYDHLQRLNQTTDALRDTLTTAVSVNLSFITLQQNETTKRLAAYAALVAVPTMIAGIYGMNFHHMPELTWLFGYPIALGTMTVIDAALFYRLRKAKWL